MRKGVQSDNWQVQPNKFHNIWKEPDKKYAVKSPELGEKGSDGLIGSADKRT